MNEIIMNRVEGKSDTGYMEFRKMEFARKGNYAKRLSMPQNLSVA
jgi:hypothetical protein